MVLLAVEFKCMNNELYMKSTVKNIYKNIPGKSCGIALFLFTNYGEIETKFNLYTSK